MKKSKTILKRKATGVWFRSDGVWLIRASANRDGKTVLDTKLTYPGHMKLSEVVYQRQKLIEDALDDIGERGVLVPTFLTYSASWILDAKARTKLPKTTPGRLSPGSLKLYVGYLERYARPHIGHISLDRITKLDLKKLSNFLATARTDCEWHPRHGQPLSQSTVKCVWALIMTVLRDGLDLYDLRDITGKIKAPLRSEEQASKGLSLDASQVQSLEEGTRGFTHGLLTMTLSRTAMRQGEARALRWAWLDHRRQGWNLPAEVTKNKKGRFVPLDDELYGLLVQNHKQQLECGHPIVQHGLVFANQRGEPVTSGQIRHFIKRHSQRILGFVICPHDLRRTWITMALEAGVPANVVRAVAGHGSDAMTELYYKPTFGGLSEAVKTVAALHANPQTLGPDSGTTKEAV